MRISDWSSDVCSSDLLAPPGTVRRWPSLATKVFYRRGGFNWLMSCYVDFDFYGRCFCMKTAEPPRPGSAATSSVMKNGSVWSSDRKSVVKGKSVSVRVDLGGRSIINKKINIET